MLPDGNARLRLLDESAARGECVSPVRSTHRRGECAVADLEGSRAVGHGNGDHVEALSNLGRDLGEDVASAGMGLVVQA